MCHMGVRAGVINISVLQIAHITCFTALVLAQSSKFETYNVLVRRSMDELEAQAVLGEGALSTVALCTCVRSRARLALKMYHKSRMTAASYQQVGKACIFRFKVSMSASISAQQGC